MRNSAAYKVVANPSSTLLLSISLNFQPLLPLTFIKHHTMTQGSVNYSLAQSGSQAGSLNPRQEFSMSNPLTVDEMKSLIENMPQGEARKIRCLDADRVMMKWMGETEGFEEKGTEMETIFREQGHILNNEVWASRDTANPPQSESPKDTTAAQNTAAAPKSTSGSQQQDSIYTRIFNAPVIGKLDVYPNR